MKKIELTAPQFGFVLATRVALAFGVGLLVSDKIPADKRKIIARSLIALGALTTIPAAMAVFGNKHEAELEADEDEDEDGEEIPAASMA